MHGQLRRVCRSCRHKLGAASEQTITCDSLLQDECRELEDVEERFATTMSAARGAAERVMRRSTRRSSS